MKNCFICNTKSSSFLNARSTVTSFSGKSVPDIFCKFFQFYSQFSLISFFLFLAEITNLIPIEFDHICKLCMIKCNEFDEYSTKIQEISKLFLDYLQKPQTTEIKEEFEENDIYIIEEHPKIEFKEEIPIVSSELLEASQSSTNPQLNPDKLPTQKRKYKKRCSSGEKKFICDYPDCNWSFKQQFRLREHQEVHNPTRDYECDICKKCFRTKNVLFGHKRTHRPGYVPRSTKYYGKYERKKPRYPDGKKRLNATCDYCGKVFADKYHFHEHYLRIHLNYRPHICCICGFRFNSNSAMKRHLAVHADEENKKIICDYCNMRFFNKDRLRKHIERHIEREYKQECYICKKRFYKKTTLNTHVRTVHLHKMKDYVPTAIDDVCSICGRLFDSKRSLAKHMKNVHDSTPLN